MALKTDDFYRCVEPVLGELHTKGLRDASTVTSLTAMDISTWIW